MTTARRSRRGELWIPGPAVPRILGAFGAVVGLVGTTASIRLIATESDGTDPIINVAFVLYGLFFAIYGIRMARVSIFARPNDLVVRNPFRTYDVEWADVAGITFEELPMRLIDILAFSWNRWSGVIELRSGKRIEAWATDSTSIFIYGRLFSQSKEVAAAKVDLLRQAWELTRRNQPPSSVELNDKLRKPLRLERRQVAGIVLAALGLLAWIASLWWWLSPRSPLPVSWVAFSSVSLFALHSGIALVIPFPERLQFLRVLYIVAAAIFVPIVTTTMR